MKILLLQLDGKLPNLALMRVAAHHREHGDLVEFRRAGNADAVAPRFGDDFDRVYASLIFERTNPLAQQVARLWPGAIIGGTGWNLSLSLDDVGIPPGPLDYSDWPRWRSSIGFTQRGCRLRCGFCVVPRKEGKVSEVATVAEIWRGAEHVEQGPHRETAAAVLLQPELDEHLLDPALDRLGRQRVEIGRPEMAAQLLVEIHQSNILPKARFARLFQWPRW